LLQPVASHAGAFLLLRVTRQLARRGCEGRGASKKRRAATCRSHLLQSDAMNKIIAGVIWQAAGCEREKERESIIIFIISFHILIIVVERGARCVNFLLRRSRVCYYFITRARRCENRTGDSTWENETRRRSVPIETWKVKNYQQQQPTPKRFLFIHCARSLVKSTAAFTFYYF
jgi:hypothetical protein